MKRLYVLVLLSACGGSSVAQVVTARVDSTFPETFTEVRAVRGGHVAAAAPVEADGSFVLALDAGDRATVELRGAGTRIVVGDGSGLPLAIDVCKPGSPIDLGDLSFSLDACGQTDACVQAEATLAQCRDPGHQGPESDACEVPDGCHEVCQAEAAALGRCLVSQPRCDLERTALETCQADAGCTPTCCRDQASARDQACAVCAPGSPAALPARPLQSQRPGCAP